MDNNNIINILNGLGFNKNVSISDKNYIQLKKDIISMNDII